MTDRPHQRKDAGDADGGSRAVGDVETPLDTAFTALANRRRRVLLDHLIDGDEVTDLDALVDVVAGAEADETPTRSHRDRVATTLYHIHLPVLAELGLVDFDPRSEAVRYHPHPTVEKWTEHASVVSER
jgi:hypothetical protein